MVRVETCRRRATPTVGHKRKKYRLIFPGGQTNDHDS